MPEGEKDARGLFRRKGKTELETLKNSRQFSEILRNGKRFRGSSIRASYRGNTLGRIRLGFSVSKKSGNSVKRNLFKRRIRMMAREEAEDKGIDIVLSPAGKLDTIAWKMIRDEFMEIIRMFHEEKKIV